MPPGKFAQSLVAAKKAKADAAKIVAEEAERKLAEASVPDKLKAKEIPPQTEDDFADLMNWIYSIPYSRRLTFVPSDFSDGVLTAEIIKHFVPHLVDLHNYQYANGRTNKRMNWELLNRKVLPQLGFKIGSALIEEIIAPKRFSVHDTTAKPYPIEKLLKKIQDRLGQISNRVFEYRKNVCMSQDPFKKRDVKRSVRPLSRQPMTEIMWRIERDAASKYGEYKGNPVTWDNIPNEEADVAALSVGISKQKFEKLKQERKAMKLQETEQAESMKSKDSTVQKVEEAAAIINADTFSTNFKDYVHEGATQTQMNELNRSQHFNNFSLQDSAVCPNFLVRSHGDDLKDHSSTSTGNTIRAKYCQSRSYDFDGNDECFSMPKYDNHPSSSYSNDISNYEQLYTENTTAL